VILKFHIITSSAVNKPDCNFLCSLQISDYNFLWLKTLSFAFSSSSFSTGATGRRGCRLVIKLAAAGRLEYYHVIQNWTNDSRIAISAGQYSSSFKLRRRTSPCAPANSGTFRPELLSYFPFPATRRTAFAIAFIPVRKVLG
jgi:hypothetical protein